MRAVEKSDKFVRAVIVEHFNECRVWVRDAASDRFDSPELKFMAIVMFVANQRQRVATRGTPTLDFPCEDIHDSRRSRRDGRRDL